MRVLAAALAGLVLPAAAALAPSPGGRPGRSILPAELPRVLSGGAWPTSHVQGLAVDREAGVVYYSFTQLLVKTDLAGAVLGTVTGLTGHLGDLTLDPRDGRVHGSLEYKAQEAFYVAVFDGARIDRVGMDAEADGVMTTVHLAEVVEDFTADMDGDGVFDGDTAATADHRYGCSGIDGVAFGPRLGSRGGEPVLVVAYGVYGDVGREDNDHQVLLEYDVSGWSRWERPLSQDAPHRSGPSRPDRKVFVPTGNTRFGVQNLAHDERSGSWLMAVYPGSKPHLPNYSLYVVDGSVEPRDGQVVGQPEAERGLVLPLAPAGLHHEPSGIRGYELEDGGYGLAPVGDGCFYLVRGREVVEDGVLKQDATAVLHRWTGELPIPFAPVP
ncbi:hypothetical protein [Auraticoccus monumenti]|uniref:Uncharacterized protein n=1 Tax=Auraticoccus monumenti TaxID=675864 RepID=A0A1G6SHI1_9ACTN|nr:hypothetical protein [Auraticoccus monumenti]SDD15627.1 hypothetical protein SAMN04489747_0315 [Auraticoccus monumenti]